MIADAENPAALSGLTRQEAAAQLQRSGYNELPTKQQRTTAHLIFDVMREPMFALLLIAGLIYLLLGDSGDALMLLGFVGMTMAITIIQERRTERVLETLRDLSSPRALVMRGGEQMRIPGREVVIGDLLILEEGDRVAADGILLEAHDLLLDESLLTGESVAVPKQPLRHNVTPECSSTALTSKHVSDATQVYSGSMIVQGGGLVRVTAIGRNTAVGRIGQVLQQLVPERSRLQHEIGILVKRFAGFGTAISVLIFLIFGWMRDDWLNGLLAGITLAMSILPEEFTVILAVFMALGAWRISKNRVLTRHLPVIEALGSATVLCVDKTGTLTQNRMSVKAVVVDHQQFTLEPLEQGQGQQQNLPETVYQLLETTVLASEKIPFDPMEKAFHRCFSMLYPEHRTAHDAWQFVHEYPLTPERMAMTHLWQDPLRPEICVATKGAPEAVVRLCQLSPQQQADVLQQVETLAAQGMRVLGVAIATYVANSKNAEFAWPDSPAAFSFTWLGLVGLADPLRPAVPHAIKECQQAGIRVVMITGDYPVTAQAIATAAGLPGTTVVTGMQMNALSDAELYQQAKADAIFARILPEQKLRLVNLLKAQGEIVAMTGDGVNDAPALKAAHIGISMGARGTDVAREASALVLLDDDFTAIVQTIRLGRRIYDNLRKAMIYVVAVHIPIAGMTLLPLLFGTPLIFAPIHIVFLEMIINPACAIVFEAEAAESNVMQRPPRKIEEHLFGTRNVALSLLHGAGLLVMVAMVFFIGLYSGANSGLEEGQARALAFTTLVIGNLGLIISSRSLSHRWYALMRQSNPSQWWILSGTLLALTIIMMVPALQRAFRFTALSSTHLSIALLSGMAILFWFEWVKTMFKGRSNPASKRVQ